MMTPYELMEARKRQGLTVERIAQVVGVHSRTVARWESSRKLPQNGIIRARYLQVLGLTKEVQP